ncbi:hypothetical protein M409DRAFT_61254 [Zasmidium cellare ATCC 36951]|uniref:Uncharacterized protein n=1 Tax=Zasmidium cellare ATCC 36951 TaxID=1080233 RepID=A0A6A6BXW9_ZASCE|nr:uncharacterized protein M409DRAFT_61254 [Zasmidium cellare ATCC 36951]KAF2158908.1 hypothetical protein M409DRAFT_61254 [Zasmidium cellare ATCC 36951]
MGCDGRVLVSGGVSWMCSHHESEQGCIAAQERTVVSVLWLYWIFLRTPNGELSSPAEHIQDHGPRMSSSGLKLRIGVPLGERLGTSHPPNLHPMDSTALTFQPRPQYSANQGRRDAAPPPGGGTMIAAFQMEVAPNAPVGDTKPRACMHEFYGTDPTTTPSHLQGCPGPPSLNTRAPGHCRKSNTSHPTLPYSRSDPTGAERKLGARDNTAAAQFQTCSRDLSSHNTAETKPWRVSPIQRFLLPARTSTEAGWLAAPRDRFYVRKTQGMAFKFMIAGPQGLIRNRTDTSYPQPNISGAVCPATTWRR